MLGKARNEDGMSDKETIEDATSQQHKIIHQMEIDCHLQIKDAEKNSLSELKERQEGERLIFSARQS